MQLLNSSTSLFFCRFIMPYTETMKATEQYFPVLLFVYVLYQAVVTFVSVPG